MKYSFLTAAFVASGLLVAAPAFAQSTSTTTTTTKPIHKTAKKQKTEGEDVTNTPLFPAASGGYAAQKQKTEGEDVTNTPAFSPHK